MSGGERRIISWVGQCPHCGESVRFKLETSFGTFAKNEPDTDWLDSLSKHDREFLDLAASTGVFASFEQAVEGRGTPPLANPSKTFLNFLYGMKAMEIPDNVSLALRTEFPTARATVYGRGDLSVIVVGGELRMFIPTARLFQKKTAKVAAKNGSLLVKDLTSDMQEFRHWVKTRMGYVPREGALFLEEMRKRCYGAFSTGEAKRAAGSAVQP